MTKTMTPIAMALFAGTAYGAVAPHNHISTSAEEKALDEAFAWSAPEEQTAPRRVSCSAAATASSSSAPARR